MGEFKWFVITFQDDKTMTLYLENIYEAIEQLVRLHNIHPREIKAISES